MKTQVVQLETYDDVISVRDKMGWGQTNRILLVWPPQGSVLDRRLDLVLLQRHSQSLGAQLALVCSYEEVRANARLLGIAVFDDVRRAQSGRWRSLRRRKANPFGRDAELLEKRQRLETARGARKAPETGSAAASITLRLAPFGLSLLALLALFVVILPAASIRLQPRSQAQVRRVAFSASPRLAAVNLAGSLPAHWQTTIVEGRGSLPVSGLVSVPEKPAAGEVQFNNLTPNPLTIPAGTIVTTLGQADGQAVQRYQTLAAVNVPAGLGSVVHAGVRAVLPGQEGNLAAGEVRSIEGPLGLLLNVTNPAALKGGSSRVVAGPNDADRQKVYERLLASLQRSAAADLYAAWLNDPLQAALPVTATLQLTDVLTRTYTPAGNLPAAQLELTLRLEFKFLLIAGHDLEQFASPVLDAALQPGQRALPGSLQVTLSKPLRLAAPDLAEGELLLSRSVEKVISPAETASLSRGLPAQQAGLLLQQRLDLAQPAQVSLWPSWWPYLPLLPMRIDIAAPGSS